MIKTDLQKDIMRNISKYPEDKLKEVLSELSQETQEEILKMREVARLEKIIYLIKSKFGYSYFDNQLSLLNVNIDIGRVERGEKAVYNPA